MLANILALSVIHQFYPLKDVPGQIRAYGLHGAAAQAVADTVMLRLLTPVDSWITPRRRG